MSLGHTLLLTVGAGVLSLGHYSTAQSPTTAKSTVSCRFDVASIRRSGPDSSGSNSKVDHGVYTASSVTLKSILEYDAFGIAGSQIVGVPEDLKSPTFDIQAKMDPTTCANMSALSHDEIAQQYKQMIQELLADRFKLVVHSEIRREPVYALIVAKGGPKLSEAKDGGAGTTLTSQTGELKARGASTAQLAQKLTRVLSDELGRTVIDKTGLTGRYDLDLSWRPDTDVAAADDGTLHSSAPSIFTAVQEQLGLKLEAAKGPVSVLVIDHAERPSQN